jgi:hypothetical protein
VRAPKEQPNHSVSNTKTQAQAGSLDVAVETMEGVGLIVLQEAGHHIQNDLQRDVGAAQLKR